jgi:hypothetical protein
MADVEEMKAGLLEAARLLRTDGVLLGIIPGETKHDYSIRFAVAFAVKLETLAAKLPEDASPSEPQERGRISKDDVDFIKSMVFQGPDMTDRQERRVKRIIDEMRLLCVPPAAPTAAGSEEPKESDMCICGYNRMAHWNPSSACFCVSPVWITPEAAPVASSHGVITNGKIGSISDLVTYPVKPKRWSGLVSLVTAAGNSEANVTLEAPVASLAPAPTILERIIERANDYREMARVSRNDDNWSAAENEDGVASGLFKAARMIREANHE